MNVYIADTSNQIEKWGFQQMIGMVIAIWHADGSIVHFPIPSNPNWILLIASIFPLISSIDLYLKIITHTVVFEDLKPNFSWLY